jgi:hypothetical protein
MNYRRAWACIQFSSEIVCAVAGCMCSMSAGGQGGKANAALPTPRAVQSAVGMVRMR